MENEITGTYTLIRKIGQGGEGEVYLAWDRKRTGYIAVKRVRRKVLDSIQEAEILKCLDHPGIPKFIGVSADKEFVCLAMGYIPGITVKEYIRRHGKVSEKQTALWGIQISSILSYLHGRFPPVIHCDIKPSNLIISKEGTLILIDFGTAKLGRKGNKKKGTRGYAPPEQMDAFGQTDEQSDIYSLGMSLYHMATGNHPLEKPWTDNLNYGLSDKFSKILKGCLETEKKNRFSSASEVQKELRKIAGKRFKVRYMAAAACSAVMIGIFGAVAGKQERPADSRFLYMAKEEEGKAEGKFSTRAVRYYEMAIEEEPESLSAYECLLRYYQSAGKEKEGLLALAEFIEAKDFSARGKDRLLMTVGEMYLQGKEGTGGYSPDPALALRYLSMQQDPSVTGQALTELADILAGGACQTDKMLNLLERIEQKAVSFRQIYFLYRIYTEKRKELEDFTDVDEKQRKLVKQMEEKAEPADDKKAVLQEKLAFYERTADRYGLDLWLEAAEQCMDAAKREEDKAEIQIKKARLLAEHNRKKEAEKAYETTISRYPKAAAGYIEYGFYLAREGKKDMAALMYRRARQLGAARDTEFQRLGAILGEGSK